jgi:hypothetical protein
MNWLSTRNTCPMCRAKVPNSLFWNRHNAPPARQYAPMVRQNARFLVETNNASLLGRIACFIFQFAILSPLIGIFYFAAMFCFIGYSLCLLAYYGLFPLA